MLNKVYKNHHYCKICFTLLCSTLLYLEKLCRFLYCEYKFVQYIAFCFVKYALHNRHNSDYVKFLILIMSSFLINKRDIFKAITLITAKILSFLPYFIKLLGKNYLRYMFYLRTRIGFALVLI